MFLIGSIQWQIYVYSTIFCPIFMFLGLIVFGVKKYLSPVIFVKAAF